MKLFNIVNQQKNREFLEQAVKNEKIANGYLFYGSEGSGYEGFAMEFAAMLNCHSHSHKPCGQCPSCKKMKSLEHGNVSLLYPVPAVTVTNNENPITRLSKSDIENLQQLIQEKARNPYKKIRMEKANNIPISLIRSLKKEIYLSAPEEGWKVVIVFDADLMKQEAANAFLKILEEPPAKTTIILTTANISKILPTIKSRCKPLYFNKLSSDDIKEYLADKNLSEIEIQLLVNLSGGNITALLKLLEKDISEIKSQTLEILRTIAGWNKKNIYYTIPKLAKIQKSDPELFIQIMSSINFWFRDAELIRLGIDQSQLVHGDQYETLKKFVENYPDFQPWEISKVIDNCIDFINRNVYINLALTNMFFQIKKYIGKKR